MCSFPLTPVPFSNPLSHVRSVRTLFTNRTELNRTGVTYPSCTVVRLSTQRQQSSYVAAMHTHASFCETATRALREKDEGILIDGRKKRNRPKQTKTIPKSRKNRLDLYANIPRCCSVSAITREKTIKL